MDGVWCIIFLISPPDFLFSKNGIPPNKLLKKWLMFPNDILHKH